MLFEDVHYFSLGLRQYLADIKARQVMVRFSSSLSSRKIFRTLQGFGQDPRCLLFFLPSTFLTLLPWTLKLKPFLFLKNFQPFKNNQDKIRHLRYLLIYLFFDFVQKFSLKSFTLTFKLSWSIIQYVCLFAPSEWKSEKDNKQDDHGWNSFIYLFYMADRWSCRYVTTVTSSLQYLPGVPSRRGM